MCVFGYGNVDVISNEGEWFGVMGVWVNVLLCILLFE